MITFDENSRFADGTRFAHEHPFTTDKDISTEAFWSLPFAKREETFAWLRANAPVSWHPAIEDWSGAAGGAPAEPGFWAVTRADDIEFVSQHNELFSSAGTVSLRPESMLTARPPTFLEMDPPHHTQYRNIMSKAFTPKAVAQLNEKIKQRAHDIVKAAAEKSEIDVVHDISAVLPMMTVADMVGFEGDEVHEFARIGADMIGGRDDLERTPEAIKEFIEANFMALVNLSLGLVTRRAADPKEDIASALATKADEVFGHALDPMEILAVFLLLSIAGNDTTKQTTTSTINQLYRLPEQREWLLEDYDGRIATSIDEFIRFAAPVMTFSRSATQDVELGGQQILAGDKVGLIYCSGNRDETRWDNAGVFDLKRKPQPHVGFGGGGVHYCLGNGVAKAQLKAVIGEVLTQMPNLTLTGEPQVFVSEFIHGYNYLPARTH